MTAKILDREVQIEVDLDEWTIAELIKNIESRDASLRVIDLSEIPEIKEWEQTAFNALQNGDKETALEALRTHLCDITGRILP